MISNQTCLKKRIMYSIKTVLILFVSIRLSLHSTKHNRVPLQLNEQM